MRIRDNSISLFMYRQYEMNQNALSRVMMQLSSGYRINSAADDAAGLAISEKMRAQIRGLNAAARNVTDAISMIQTAEGAMDSLHSILQRMNELAVQAATGTNDELDRGALNKEFAQLKAEITDIAAQTNFNGINLLDGSRDSIVIQSGVLEGHTTAVPFEEMSLTALGLEHIDLSTQDNASRAITAVRRATSLVSDQRTTLGAMHNRFEYKYDNLVNQSFNLRDAESRIRDTDMAAAMMDFIRLNIRQQVLFAIMAQCNANAYRILTLFQNL